MNVIIFGPPGSGKGTYASRLHTMLGVNVIATGDILREIMKADFLLAKKVKGYVNRGLLVPDDIVIEVLKRHLAKLPREQGLIFDGYPRNINQAKALKKIVKIDAIIQLVVPDWILIERLSNRRICKKCGEVYNIRYLKPKIDMLCDKCGEQLYQRSDDTPKVIKDRIKIYESQTQPLLKYYKEKGFSFIKSEINKLEIPPEVVLEKILIDLKKLKLV